MRRGTERRVETRVGVSGVLIVDERVLLVQQAYDSRWGTGRGYWWIPGGYVQGDETLSEAVEREFQEETGLIAKAEGVIAVRSRPTDVVVVFRMRRVGGELQPDGKEIAAARYFSLEELEAAEDVMGLSREIARTALRGEATILRPHGYRPADRLASQYVLYM